MDPTVVSAKYFDKNFQHFEHVEDWWDIPTPVFQSIMDYQKFDKEVSKWLYVMGGRCACFTSHRLRLRRLTLSKRRCCFDVGDIDGWQVIPFLKGIAQSGKSTIITKVRKLCFAPPEKRLTS